MALLSEEARLLESVMFIENEAMDMEKLISMTGLEEKVVTRCLKELQKNYEATGHGLFVKQNEDETWCFAPCQDLYDKLRKTYGRKVDRRLSRASLETLSIIAYSQPITRREIDNIRGVTSDTIVRLLRDREYIKVVGRKDVQGHPCLYGTSRKFLFEFGLQSISDLPKLSEMDKERFEKSDEGEDFSE